MQPNARVRYAPRHGQFNREDLCAENADRGSYLVDRSVVLQNCLKHWRDPAQCDFRGRRTLSIHLVSPLPAPPPRPCFLPSSLDPQADHVRRAAAAPGLSSFPPSAHLTIGESLGLRFWHRGGGPPPVPPSVAAVGVHRPSGLHTHFRS